MVQYKSAGFVKTDTLSSIPDWSTDKQFLKTDGIFYTAEDSKYLVQYLLSVIVINLNARNKLVYS